MTDDAALRRQRTIEQAADEGHDADIPSNIGFVLNEKVNGSRRPSLTSDQVPSAGKAVVVNLSHKPENADLEAAADTNTTLSGHEYDHPAGRASTEVDPNIVWWEDDNDPENPYNWPQWRKMLTVGMVSMLTFVTPLASSIFAPGTPELMREFQVANRELGTFVVSIYVLGFAFGPLLLAPLSEIYGRTIVYHVCNIGFLAFVIACAVAPSMEALIAFRFISGLLGACPITNGGGTIADIVPQNQRGRIMSLYTVGPLFGPIVGPVAGGFLAGAKGWRWTFWLLSILAGVLMIGMMIFMKETYAPVILERKAARLRKETGNQLLRSKLDAGLSSKDYFTRSIVRPMKMMLFSPITQVFSLYVAVVYGYLYLLFTTITPVFISSYGFSTSTVGLVFLGLGGGSMLGMIWVSSTSDKYVTKKAAEDGTEMKPEHRLHLLPWGAMILPIGFFIYAWTVEYRVHWIVPILAMGVIGIGNILSFMTVTMYLIDAFQMYAASALAANTVIRSIGGAVLPLAALPMYAKLGLGWGNSLLAFIALALAPMPIIIQRYGEYLRTRFKVDL